jgi:hypothetical protein
VFDRPEERRIGSKMMRSVSPARTLFAALLLLPLTASAGPPTKRPTSRYGIPRLAPGQVWVSSVPVGLEVRLGEDLESKPIGRTPLVVEGRNVGRSLSVTIGKKKYGGALPDQTSLIDFSGKTTHSLGKQYGTRVEDLGRAITYELQPGKRTLIALFQSRDWSLSELARLYPPGSNFRFSDELVEKRLTEKGVPPNYVRAGIRLLHRGGKVALPGLRGWLIAEVTSSGKVELLESPQTPSK